MKYKQKGFTLTEFAIVIVVIIIIAGVCVAGIYGTLLKGNMWYTEDGVLQELKLDHPNVTHIVKTVRNAWDYSEIIVQEGENRNTYYLDSDFFWNYEFYDNPDE